MNSREIRSLQEAYLEVYQELDEAEGSYGQTPKAHQAFNKLRAKRQETDAKAFRGKKGGKTAAVDRALHHTGRSGNIDWGHSGRTSPRPEDLSIRHKMTPNDRTFARQEREFYNDPDNEGDFYGDPDPKGSRGSLPKSKKKLARQKATGVSAESYDLYDIILSHLLDEGYANTLESAEAIMVNMSEGWIQDIVEDTEYLDEELPDNTRRRAIRHIKDTKKLLKSMAREIDYNYNPEPEGYEPESDKKIKKRTQKEQVDLYDIILSHLLDEGYANTPEAAEAIMVNMSEDWREDIVEELTGARKKRALEIGTPLAKRVAHAKEGQPITRKGPPYLGSTQKAPTKRGGIGSRGKGKSEWTGYESDRGQTDEGGGHRWKRKMGRPVPDTSDDL